MTSSKSLGSIILWPRTHPRPCSVKKFILILFILYILWYNILKSSSQPLYDINLCLSSHLVESCTLTVEYMTLPNSLESALFQPWWQKSKMWRWIRSVVLKVAIFKQALKIWVRKFGKEILLGIDLYVLRGHMLNRFTTSLWPHVNCISWHIPCSRSNTKSLQIPQGSFGGKYWMLKWQAFSCVPQSAGSLRNIRLWNSN